MAEESSRRIRSVQHDTRVIARRVVATIIDYLLFRVLSYWRSTYFPCRSSLVRNVSRDIQAQ